MTLSDTEKKIINNKSRTYLLPLISKDIKLEYDYLLINTYIKFNKNVDIEYPFGLLYEVEPSPIWAEYNEYLMSIESYYRGFTIGEDKKLFVFRFPDRYTNEYLLFKEGKYSKFDVEAKSLIISYSAEAYKYPPLIEDLTGVLWKHKSRRMKLEKALDMKLPDDCELASKIEYDNETFIF